MDPLRALALLICLLATACATSPPGRLTRDGTRIVLGRINATPTVNILVGHVTMNDTPIYEVALEGPGNRLVAFIQSPGAECPYNSRPREQLFRIEYGISNQWASLGHDFVPDHLATRFMVVRCEMVVPARGGRH